MPQLNVFFFLIELFSLSSMAMLSSHSFPRNNLLTSSLLDPETQSSLTHTKSELGSLYFPLSTVKEKVLSISKQMNVCHIIGAKMIISSQFYVLSIE